MTFLELCQASSETVARKIPWMTLSNGIRIRYAVDADIGGGSGGTEAELRGELQLGAETLVLTCRDQGERPDPEWCIAYLGHLKSAGANN
jgi:hypothetical protein